MELDELLQILTRNRDYRFKDEMKQKLPYYVFIKNKKHGIFYVKYTDTGIQISTGEKEKIKAVKFAIEHLNDHTPEGIKAFNKNDEFHELLLEYYKTGSEHINYCIRHNRRISEKDRPNIERVMKRICELTPDITKYKDLTKRRLIQLQNDLIEHGSATGSKLSEKTVKNYFFDLHRVYKELLDFEKIDTDPFLNLPRLKTTLTQAWGGFPLTDFEKKLPIYADKNDKIFNVKNQIIYSLLGFIALMTGTRKGELEKINYDCVTEVKSADKEKGIGIITQYWLYVDGTKTKNAKRTIPITELTAKALKVWTVLKQRKELPFLKNADYNEKTLLFMGRLCGIKTLGELKNGNEKIVFHGFRKMYRTVLTQQNINRDLIDFCMGKETLTEHDRRNVKNDKDTYLELSKSDNTKWHDNITNALSFFERKDTDFFNFFCYGILEQNLDLERAFELADKATKDKIKFSQWQKYINYDVYWGRKFTDKERAENRIRLKELGFD